MRKETRSLAAVVASHGAMHSYLVVLPALLPLMKEELGGYFTLGLLSSIVFMVYGWGSFPVGILADRFSKKKMIVLSMSICGIGSILISLSQGLLSATVSFIILGIGASLYHPVGYSLISLLPQKQKGRYMGIQGLGGNVGMALGFIISTAMGSFWGWRYTFLSWGVFGIILSMINGILILEPDLATRSKSNSIQEKVHIKNDPKKKTNLAAFFLIIPVIICSGALWIGVSSFLVTYINETKHTTLLVAGGLATISYAVSSVAQLSGGEISDRFGRRIVLLAGFGLFSLALFLFTLPFSSGPLLAILLVVALGFLFFMTQPALNVIIGNISSPGRRGTAFGMNFMIKYGIGGISPLIAGYLATKSMNLAFYFFALIAATAFLLLFFSYKFGKLNNVG